MLEDLTLCELVQTSQANTERLARFLRIKFKAEWSHRHIAALIVNHNRSNPPNG